MSVILFFGYSLLVLLAGAILTGISLHHIWKNRSGQILDPMSGPLPEEKLNDSANLDKPQS